MLKIAIAALAAALAGSPVAAQEKPLSMEEFSKLLTEKLGSDALVTSAEIFAEKSDGSGQYLAYGYANTFSSPPAPETPCGAVDFIETQMPVGFKQVWCYSHKPGFEARRDTYLLPNGSPPLYRVTAHYDCQNATDKAAMPVRTRTLVCP